jgi:hypothetical protein
VPHHDEAVGTGRREVEVMEHGDDRSALAGEIGCGIHHRELMAQIKAGDGFVEEQDLAGCIARARGELRQNAGEGSLGRSFIGMLTSSG